MSEELPREEPTPAAVVVVVVPVSAPQATVAQDRLPASSDKLASLLHLSPPRAEVAVEVAVAVAELPLEELEEPAAPAS